MSKLSLTSSLCSLPEKLENFKKLHISHYLQLNTHIKYTTHISFEIKNV